MRNKPRYHQKGSVIVMVVGLLVMLAMIGTTFIIIASMDRRESHSIATAAPMKHVAGGVLQQIRVKLADDLYIDAAGVIYASATNYKQQVEFPHEDYDKHLASYGPVLVNGVLTWRHISNHNSSSGYADVAANDVSLVDTDGISWGGNAGDAKLFDSGVTNRSGQKYYVAVRLIDASSLMNINSAYSISAAASGTVMPITNMALDILTNTATRDSVHAARNGSTTDNIATFNTNYVRRPLNPVVNTYRPFDISDILASGWGGVVPNTASGRLWEALGTQFNAAKPYITVHSASRDYIRRATGNLDLTHRVNLNSTAATATVFVELFKAFYNTIPAGIAGFTDDDNARRLVAAQLAVNVIDYRDTGDVPYQPLPLEIATVGLVAGTKIFGVERQPFITEAWLRMEWVGGATGSLQQLSAIELYNPYKSAISLTGYKLKVGATTNNLQNPPNIPAGGRVVIVSSTAEIQALGKSQDTNLKLTETCTLLRQTSVAGSYAPVGSVDVGEFGLAEPNFGAPGAVHARIRRDDTASRAKYSVAVYTAAENYTYRIGDGGCPSADDTNLGRGNSDVDLGAAVAPTPVFVRNGNLINLGEVSRIFYVGPTSSDMPLDEVLASMSPGHFANGRLYARGTIKAGTDPQIPAACMLSDYMDVLVPDTNNTGRTDTIYGRININTAPWQVIQYLPGIASLSTQAQRELVAKDIVAYRDLLDNTVTTGGTDYSGGGTARASAMVPVLTDLREDAGFGSPGEVAIPLAKIITLPNNTYSASAPNSYRVADSSTSDDGLNDIVGDLSKYDIYHSWLSNQVTVRSDVYIAYIRVQIGNSPTTNGPVRRYVAVIDRSNCTSANDLPEVLMFAPLK